MSVMSVNLSLCAVPCFTKKNNRVIKQRNVYNNTKGFLIRTHPHHVCHSHHKVFSSAPVCTVAQVEKHCSKACFRKIRAIKIATYFHQNTWQINFLVFKILPLPYSWRRYYPLSGSLAAFTQLRSIQQISVHFRLDWNMFLSKPSKLRYRKNSLIGFNM